MAIGKISTDDASRGPSAIAELLVCINVFFHFDLISVKFDGPGFHVYRMKTTNKPRRKHNFSKDTKVVNAKKWTKTGK